MIKLDKTKSYYLGDLSDGQKDALCKEAGIKEYDRHNLDSYKYVCFDNNYNMWLYGDEPNFEVVNALELFYTLKNVQVDCRELSEEQIKEMCKVYESNGFKYGLNEYKTVFNDCYLRYGYGIKEVLITDKSKKYNTITYDKFMELFSKEEENVLTEIMKDEYKATFCDSYKSVKPQHYSKGIDTFKRMEENCTLEERLAFAKGNIDKYTWRTKGQDKEDLVKIISYAKWALKQLENEQSTK